MKRIWTSFISKISLTKG